MSAILAVIAGLVLAPLFIAWHLLRSRGLLAALLCAGAIGCAAFGKALGGDLGGLLLLPGVAMLLVALRVAPWLKRDAEQHRD